MMAKASLPLLLALVLAASGCQNDPFQVVSPSLERETGTALVSVQVPSFVRGLIHRVSLQVTAADTGSIRTIRRDMNFPIPGGNLAVGQVADVPAGVRRFTVAAYDTAETKGIPRFRGSADSVVHAGQTQLVQIVLSRVGGTVAFAATLDTAAAGLDSAAVAGLPLTSVLDILELVPDPHHSALAMLPLASVGLGTRWSLLDDEVFSRRVTVSQIPTGTRRFVAQLKDLSSGKSLAFVDTVDARVDTFGVAEAVFELQRVRGQLDLEAIFTQPTLPPDSTVVVIVPQF
jgi:hypothetical protein